MRNQMTQAFVLLLLLSACSETKKEIPKDSLSQKPSPVETSHKLQHSDGYEENVVIALAGTLVAAGHPLDSQTAESCFHRESTRPRVRWACVLAWSIGNEDSVTLFRALRESLQSGREMPRPAVLAAVRKNNFAATLELEEISRLLTFLRDEPAWIRARLIRNWLRKNTPKFSEAHKIWEMLDLGETEEEPVSLADAYSVSKVIGVDRSQTMLREFCVPGIQGPAQSRCWRFLSALLDPSEEGVLPLELLPFPRSIADSGWILFERSFPERALLLKKYLR